jgi:hypothetical protein
MQRSDQEICFLIAYSSARFRVTPPPPKTYLIEFNICIYKISIISKTTLHPTLQNILEGTFGQLELCQMERPFHQIFQHDLRRNIWAT